MKLNKGFFVVAFLFCHCLLFGQEVTKDSIPKGRLKFVVASQAIVYTGTLISLSQLWYNEDKGSFHTFDDSNQWNKLDKMGHIYSAYQLSRVNTGLYRWAGLSKKKSAIYGSVVGFLFMTPIEIMDGFASEYGFSWSDMAANAIGASVFCGQELLWGKQLVKLKFSYHATPYANIRPNTLGSTWSERLLKDYNGHTYWLSFDLHEMFFRGSKFPKWLNFTVGYGAEGMVYGTEEANIKNGYKSTTSVYFSVDLDLAHIKTKNKLLNTLLFIADGFRLIPFPTLKYNTSESWELYPNYY